MGLFVMYEVVYPQVVNLLRASPRLYRAVAEGAIKIKRKRKGPRGGEDFTSQQALIKADFWLVFLTLACGAGSGLTVIDNLGQIVSRLVFPILTFLCR